MASFDPAIEIRLTRGSIADKEGYERPMVTLVEKDIVITGDWPYSVDTHKMRSDIYRAIVGNIPELGIVNDKEE